MTITTKFTRSFLLSFAILLTAFSFSLTSGYSDTVTLKDGSKLEGKITVDTADFIKIVLARSGSIKETKLVKRADIASIAKTAPDTLALEKIKKDLPTRSLMTASAYQSLIQTGPEAFLKAFPTSLHKTEVKKILEELNTEKAKVERGAIKLEGEWISAERRQNFKELTNSQIRLYLMKQKARQRDHSGALRDLQIIEDQFIGTPAYPQAVKIALSILPSYGKLLTRQLKDAEFLNTKREADIKLLPPENRARTEAAYKKEQDRFKALAEQEKKSGIKWRSVNRRNKDSLSSMISTIRQEIDRLKKIDLAKFAEQARLLVAVDELINENKLKEAQEKLLEAGGKKSSSKSGKKSSRSSRSKKSDYSADLSNKIATKIHAVEEKAKNATLAAKGKEAAAAIGQASTKVMGKDGEATADEKKEGESESALDAAMAARKKAAAAKSGKTEAETDGKKSKKSKKKKSSRKKVVSEVVEDEGSGLNLQMIMIALVVIGGITIVVLKKMGIGGGSKSGEAGEGGSDE